MTTAFLCLIVGAISWITGVKLADWLYDLTH